MKKLFILPSGATRETGTTWFRLKNGEELILHSDKPMWTIFENSEVEHSLVSAAAYARPTIEVDLLPATATSPNPFYAGINGWYPWFPTESGFFEGTRLALTFAKSFANDPPIPAAPPIPASKIVAEPTSQSLLRRALRKARRMLRPQA